MFISHKPISDEIQKTINLLTVDLGEEQVKLMYLHALDLFFPKMKDFVSVKQWFRTYKISEYYLQHLLITLDKEHVIAPTAPFYRDKIEFTAVRGVEAKAWYWNPTAKGLCSNPACGKTTTMVAENPLGTIFMFDVDESIEVELIETYIERIIRKFNLSHMILTKTTKGWHLWCCDIFEHRNELFALFDFCKTTFNSDYEFASFWILRIDRKLSKSPPYFIRAYINKDVRSFRRISQGHLEILNAFANMPEETMIEILDQSDPISTYARQVQYYSIISKDSTMKVRYMSQSDGSSTTDYRSVVSNIRLKARIKDGTGSMPEYYSKTAKCKVDVFIPN